MTGGAALAGRDAPPDADVLLAPAFVSETERRALLAWARAMEPHLRANATASTSGNAPRRFRRVERLPRIDPLYTAVRLRLQHALGIPADAEPEPQFGWYLSIIRAGGLVHLHIDSAPPGKRHLRANLFLQLPYKGGLPVIETRARQVAEGMVLAFFPSERPHMSQPVFGRRRRIILSFGYLVPGDYALPAALTR
ncbi:hypothetical protein ACFQ1E_10815 [Sphingomonas canadensis]|uniref:Prolyl 4-hydroxylase alpha subunit Fe(2+) 2OG dioxygenase domain-containing protein n=1 Tax=Sphingomonas canadensis TaxID=1219257 RepID=A0ABW3H8R3_9SPHN|nr:hypothetical protein [Sphingomonas canadensis]MCW3836389.1 hypothetical protein [Sphingomonas canadensis]